MALLDLETAVSQILQACDETTSGQRPFVFVVGAGLSSPHVPLAREIVDHCRTIAEKYNRTRQPGSMQPIDIYSHWFELAYPHALQRQRYIRSLIEGKPIAPAYLRLAHLMLNHFA